MILMHYHMGKRHHFHFLLRSMGRHLVLNHFLFSFFPFFWLYFSFRHLHFFHPVGAGSFSDDLAFGEPVCLALLCSAKRKEAIGIDVWMHVYVCKLTPEEEVTVGGREVGEGSCFSYPIPA